MANANRASLSNSLKTLFERKLLTRLLPRLVHGKFGKQATFKGYNQYELRRWESLDAVTSALGTTGNTPSEGQAPTITVVTLTPEWYGSWVGFTEDIDLTSYDPVVDELSGLLGEQAGLSFDTLVRNDLTGNFTADFSGGATARGEIDNVNDIISFVDYIQNVAALEANDVPGFDGDAYPVILHPHSWSSLMQDSTFVTLFTREGGGALRTGKIGSILNTDIYISSNARIYSAAGQNSEDVYTALFIGRESYGMAGITGFAPDLMEDSNPPQNRGGMTGQEVRPVDLIVHPPGSAGSADPMNQRGSVAWKGSHDLEILDSSRGRVLEHATDFS